MAAGPSWHEIGMGFKRVYRHNGKKKLKELIPNLTNEDLTYQDWFKGGSYDLLTLDYGRYYVEHGMNFFECHFPLAMALADTFKALPQIAGSLGLKDRTVSQIFPRILQGYSPKQLAQLNPHSLSTCELIHEHVEHHFKSVYLAAHFSTHLLQESTIKELSKKLGLHTTQKNVDRMRIILWEWLQRQDKTKIERLLCGCQPSISWATFHQHYEALKKCRDKKPCGIPTVKDYQAWGLLEPASVYDQALCYPRQLIRLVEKAGLTNIVALTGWRKSEFGFPASSIHRFKNDDKLDEYAFPLRYQVDWYVYKTHDKVRQKREITFSTTLLAERLQQLIGVDSGQPCLYPTTPSKHDAFESCTPVTSAVIALWGHYVKHYPDFIKLDKWQRWRTIVNKEQSEELLTEAQQREKEQLLTLRSTEEWSQLTFDGNLKEAWRVGREEWPKLEFFFTSETKDKLYWVARYRNGTLRKDWTALLDTPLSEETWDWLRSLSEDDCKSSVAGKTITGELLANTLYPMPHAFRHMWAEAVYRRFDGDAGWMIRSQFKHISRSMWLAYIRDKDNRHDHQRVKVDVINSLVQNYLKNKGAGYAGQLHTWLRRLFRKTVVMTPEEQTQFADPIATTEIEDIKANPWGYCLLKRRTLNKARCAEMGEPMRHNASPFLCLSCIHNLMQTDNVDWILLHICTHVEALKNPVVPDIFKASSYELVKNSTRHVRTLNPKHEALPELQEILDNYNAARAA